MTLFHVMLFVHILASMVWIGGAFMTMLVGNALRSRGDAPQLATYCAVLNRLSAPVFGAAALLVLATGVWMVIDSPAYDFSAMWISIGFTGWFLSSVLGTILMARAWGRVGTALEQPGATIAANDALLTRANVISWIDLLVRVAVVLVMVWRPT